MSPPPLPCPVCQREISKTKAGTRSHVAESHPDRAWSRVDDEKITAARHAYYLDADRLELLNEERFTWLYMAVAQEQRRRANERPPGAPWDPWIELRRRPWIDLEWAYLDSGVGRIDDLGGGRRLITLDARLPRPERRFTLAHELVHEERGGGVDVPGAPAWWQLAVVADEATVDHIAARRLGVDAPS